MVNNQPKKVILLFCCLLTTACSQKSYEHTDQILFNPVKKLHSESKTDVREKFDDFQLAIDSFLSTPTAKTLGDLQEEWIYLHDTLHRFQLLAHPSSRATFSTLIDSWPIEPVAFRRGCEFPQLFTHTGYGMCGKPSPCWRSL